MYDDVKRTTCEHARRTNERMNERTDGWRKLRFSLAQHILSHSKSRSRHLSNHAHIQVYDTVWRYVDNSSYYFMLAAAAAHRTHKSKTLFTMCARVCLCACVSVYVCHTAFWFVIESMFRQCLEDFNGSFLIHMNWKIQRPFHKWQIQKKRKGEREKKRVKEFKRRKT